MILNSEPPHNRGVIPSRRTEAADFLRRRFGKAPPDLCVLIWTKKGKKSHWLSVGQMDEAEAFLAPFCKADAGDVYAGVALSPKDYGPKFRCVTDQTAGIAGLWADIDVKGPAHKSDTLPETIKQARALARSVGLKPSEEIISGHGLQAWWLFDEPWLFRDDKDRQRAADLSRRFQALLQSKARTRGWKLDPTHDLARILRVPGTFNHKTASPVRVRVLDTGPSHSLEDILALLEAGTDTTETRPRHKANITQRNTESAEDSREAVCSGGSESHCVPLCPLCNLSLLSPLSDCIQSREKVRKKPGREWFADVEGAIVETQPNTEGQRHRKVFDLCRRLKAITALADSDPVSLRHVVLEWHGLAEPVIATKPFSESWADFLSGWAKVRHAAGEGPIDQAFRRAAKRKPPQRAVELYGEHDPAVLLASLCRELQRDAGDAPFFLDCRTAGRLLGVNHKSAWKCLKALCSDGVLKLVSKGSRETHQASSYLYEEG